MKTSEETELLDDWEDYPPRTGCIAVFIAFAGTIIIGIIIYYLIRLLWI